MTREQLRGIIEGITEGQLKEILDINSADTGKAKQAETQLKTALEQAETKLQEVTSELDGMKELQGEAEEIKKQYEELQKVLELKNRQEQELQLESRFSKASGNAEFINSYTRQGVFSEFVKALELQENQGKSDAEIYGTITIEDEMLFQPHPETPKVVQSTMGFGGDLTDGDIREIMGLL